MYNAKHIRKRRLRWRREFVLVCSIAILVLGMVGGSLAYLFTNTDDVTNTFTPATIGVDIDENLTEQTKSNVRFQNTGDLPVYMRAKVIVNWEDENGNIVADVPEGYSVTRSALGQGWTAHGDGYFYYNQPVDAGEYSGVLYDSITAVYPEDHEYYLLVDVLVETIQAEPEQAVIDAWGFVPSAA